MSLNSPNVSKIAIFVINITQYQNLKNKSIEKLTGHAKSNGNDIGLSKPSESLLPVNCILLSPTTNVENSPNVQLVLISIFAW